MICCRLFKSNPHGRAFGPQCNAGDKIGCGINFSEAVNDDPQRRMVPVVFTRNGSEVASCLLREKLKLICFFNPKLKTRILAELRVYLHISYIFATKAHIGNRKKIVKQQYLLHKSTQYGELRPTGS